MFAAAAVIEMGMESESESETKGAVNSVDAVVTAVVDSRCGGADTFVDVEGIGEGESAGEGDGD